MTQYRPHLRHRLKQAFERAALTHDLGRVRPEDLRRVRDIEEHARRLRARAREYFKRNHVTLVQRERERMIQEAGAVRRDLKPFGIGEDRFDSTASYVQADRHVHQREEQLIARIGKALDNEWDKLAKGGRDGPPRDPSRGRLKLVFDRARTRNRDR